MSLTNRWLIRIGCFVLGVLVTLVAERMVSAPAASQSSFRSVDRANTTAAITQPIAGARRYKDGTGTTVFEVTAPEPKEFPEVVAIETGKKQFTAGDEITITEVRGTSSKMAIGNFYQIKGTYKLVSHGPATLSCYVSARDRENGYGPVRESQNTAVTKGEGAFTVVCPLFCRGYPHLTMRAENGAVADVYFGAGEFLSQ